MKIYTIPLSFKKIVAFLLYPISIFLQLPFVWLKSIWYSRILFYSKNEFYNGFCPSNSINSFFYKTQAINIKKFGRTGISTNIGLGNYPLSSWFHISIISNYIYSKAGALTTFLCTLIWAFSHFIWKLDSNSSQKISILCIIIFSSTTSYSMAFARQNYQIIGWMFFPLALFFLNHDFYILSSIFWLIASISGITSIFFSIILVVLFSFDKHSISPFFSIFPTLILWLIYLYPLFTNKDFLVSSNNILKLIGLSKRKVKYRREQKLQLEIAYFFILYSVCLVSFYFITSIFPFFSIFILILFLFNELFIRIADDQTFIILFISLLIFEICKTNIEWRLLVLLWFAINPHPYFLSIKKKSKSELVQIKINPPFDHSPLIMNLNSFLGVVPSTQKVYFAFSDPQNKYSNIFDGYRILLEPLLYVASEKGINIFPDWYAVSDTNYIDAPNIWGRDKNQVLQNLDYFKTNYVIIYQESGTILQALWHVDFDEVSTFDWKDVEPLLREVHLWSNTITSPKWFLLKRKIVF